MDDLPALLELASLYAQERAGSMVVLLTSSLGVLFAALALWFRRHEDDAAEWRA